MPDDRQPPLDIPFTDDQLALMGRIAVIWGQIDEGLNFVLRSLLKLPPNVFESLVGNQMIGRRVDHLREFAETLNEGADRELLNELVAALKEVGPRRNTAMHGCWGLYPLSPDCNAFKIGIFNHQKPTQRFWMEDVAELYVDLCATLSTRLKVRWNIVQPGTEPVEYAGHRVFFSAAMPRAGSFRRGEMILNVSPPPPGWHD